MILNYIPNYMSAKYLNTTFQWQMYYDHFPCGKQKQLYIYANGIKQFLEVGMHSGMSSK